MKEKKTHKPRNFFRMGTIFTQLVLFTTVVNIVPIIFISYLLFHKKTNLVTDELVDTHYQLATQYTSNLESKFFQYRESL